MLVEPEVKYKIPPIENMAAVFPVVIMINHSLGINLLQPVNHATTYAFAPKTVQQHLHPRRRRLPYSRQNRPVDHPVDLTSNYQSLLGA